MSADFYSRGSAGVNNQLFVLPWGDLYRPNSGLGPTLRGLGGDQALPTIPTQNGSGISVATGTRQSAANITPQQWMILGGMFIVGALILRYVHWRG